MKRQLECFFKKIIYGYKATSASYIKHLNAAGATISESVYLVVPHKITIDETRPYLIEIGENVTLTEGVQILTHGFDWSVLKIKYGDVIGSAGKVTIRDNCFIGVNSIILKGCTIGENSIIGAGSLVCSDIPPNSVAAGNPCKVISTLDDYYNKRKNIEIEEAKELIKQYYTRFKVLPPEKELAEFFWLFHNNDSIPEYSRRKMEYGGIESYKYSKTKYQQCSPMFDSYEILCEEALKYEQH